MIDERITAMDNMNNNAPKDEQIKGDKGGYKGNRRFNKNKKYFDKDRSGEGQKNPNRNFDKERSDNNGKSQNKNFEKKQSEGKNFHNKKNGDFH